MEGTSTLADALLDDLDDLSDVEEETYEEEDVSMQQEMVPESLSSQYDWWPRHQKRLLDDPELQKHVLVIRNIMDAKSKRANTTTDQQQQQQQQREEDHKLLVKSNEYLLAAANDLNTEHTSLCAAYEPKFPELEELVPDATQYVNAVRCIGNESDLTSKAVNDSLNGFLSNHQIITLSVAGSTSAGRPLTELELQRVDQIATYMEEIMAIRELLTQHIEQQMESTCPNMTALIGPSTSAKLLSLTGGLPALAKIPACNLQVLGQVKQSRNGMVSSSSSMATPHQGVLVQADLVQCCPRHLQPKVLKMVAAKLALAIRCDFVNADAGRTCTAASGRLFREQIEKKFVQLQEPDKAPVLKALPK